MALPAFSVIIPTFNRRRTIERALTSVLAQRHPAGEVILVDDASDDDTVAFVRRHFPKVCVVQHECNSGAAVARNTAIQLATHDHLAFLDSDDAWHEDFLATVGEAWREHPEASIVFTQYDKIEDRPGGRINPIDVRIEGDQIAAMLRNNFIHTCSIMSTRRDRTIDVGGLDPAYKINHDRAMYLRLLLHGPAIAVPRRLVKRHVADDNLIHDLEQWWREATILITRFVSHPDFARYRWVEDESRSHVWEAIRGHDRQRVRAMRDVHRTAETGTPKVQSSISKRPAQNRPSDTRSIHLFVHAGGLPSESLSAFLTSTCAFGHPAAWFDHDGFMLEKVRALGAANLDGYIDALLGEAEQAGQPWSALMSYRDLAWLEPTSTFRRLVKEYDVRVVRFRCRDLVLQACRLATMRHRPGCSDEPLYDAIAESIVMLEEAESFGDRWLADRRFRASSLWLEDLYEPGLLALNKLLPETTRQICPALDPPTECELAIAKAFREEAASRNWQHALLPVSPISL